MKYFSVDYFEGLKNIVLQFMMNNYDYCYLDAMHEKNRVAGTSTIITGSSHAMNGIIESRINGGCINFSISSQDLYFDFQHIVKAVEEGKQKIKSCIINIGYYMLYHDLSLSKVMRYLIPKVYEPLFKETHHYIIEKPYDMLADMTFDRDMYTDELVCKLCTEWSRGFFLEEPTYYGSLRTRENNNILGLKKIIWSELQKEEKQKIAIDRTGDHNRLRKHEDTRIENGILIQKMVEYLWNNGITPIFVIFPFTQYYNDYIDHNYRIDIFNLLDGLSYPVEFLDMNDYPEIFDDSDFLDTDHLNSKGAAKASDFLNEFLLLINQKGSKK